MSYRKKLITIVIIVSVLAIIGAFYTINYSQLSNLENIAAQFGFSENCITSSSESSTDNKVLEAFFLMKASTKEEFNILPILCAGDPCFLNAQLTLEQQACIKKFVKRNKPFFIAIDKISNFSQAKFPKTSPNDFKQILKNGTKVSQATRFFGEKIEETIIRKNNKETEKALIHCLLLQDILNNKYRFIYNYALRNTT